MFVLEGGPRGGQLVDELPTGYAPVDVGEEPVRVVLFEDFVARKARWTEGERDELAAERDRRPQRDRVGADGT